jgi:hypothetical protein
MPIAHPTAQANAASAAHMQRRQPAAEAASKPPPPRIQAPMMALQEGGQWT